MEILIVGTEGQGSRALAESLALAGHEVSQVPSSGEGVERVKSGPPACVVLETDEAGQKLEEFRRSLGTPESEPPVPVVPWVSGQDPAAVLQGIAEILDLPAPAPAAGPSPVAPPTKTALLIDDREVHRRRIAAQMTNEGWRVLEATDGRKGALLIIDERIDCMLVSGMIAGKTSHGVVRSAAEIRRVHPNPFSILVMTDSHDAALIAQVLAAGADDVVVRQAGATALIRRLDAALKLRALLRENRRLRDRIAALEARVAG